MRATTGMGRVARHLLAIVTIAFLVQWVPSHASAEQSVRQGPTGTEIGAFFDEYLPAKMQALHIAGATVAVVLGEQVAFSKGFGVADTERQIPVTPDNTLFVLGSLSKVFTWTAVMQLVERGMLDLDSDVNRYLDFSIPATFAQPITLHHLMAHNAGLDDGHYGQMSADASQQPRLGEWLKSHLPRRVYPPGTVTAYANYGAALAGYIVERVSGIVFADYVEQNILLPLRMERTTIRQLLPESLRDGMSKGYLFDDGKYVSQSSILDAVLNPAPAGAVRGTAADMARFMRAHLNAGCAGTDCILRPETARLMQESSFPRDPRSNGMAHGFWQLDMNGQRILGHAGSHFIFSGMLLLLPEHRLGVYVGSNSAGGRAFLGESYMVFLRDFVQRIFPRAMPTMMTAPDFGQRGKRFGGTYHLTTGQSHDSPERVFSLLMSMGINADPDGMTLLAPWGKERYVEIEPMVFREVDRDTRLVFRQDGSVIKANYSVAPLTELVKNRWFEAPSFNLSLLAGCIVTFLSYLVTTAIGILRRHGKAAQAKSAVCDHVAHWAGISVCFVGLVLVFAIAVSLANTEGIFLAHLPGWAWVRVGSVVFAGMAGIATLSSVVSWTQPCQGLARRIHRTLVSIAGLGMVWFMSFWNLLGRGW